MAKDVLPAAVGPDMIIMVFIIFYKRKPTHRGGWFVKYSWYNSAVNSVPLRLRGWKNPVHSGFTQLYPTAEAGRSRVNRRVFNGAVRNY